MIFTLILLGLSPFLILLVVYALKDIISKRKMRFYTDQGVVSAFVPVTGAYSKIHTPVSSGQSFEKLMKGFFDFFKTHENNPHKMVVTNTFNSTEPTIYLTDLDSISEFIAKENDCYSRIPGYKNDTNGFFFFQNEETALKGRASFAEFFKHENIIQLLVVVQ